MIKVAVSGAAGRMGSLIARLAARDPEVELVSLWEVKGHPAVGKEARELGIESDLVVSDEPSAPPGTVVIEFTTPQATMEHLEGALGNRWKMVIGTTGLSDEHIRSIEKASEKIAIVRSPNMSVGINLINVLLEKIVPILSDYEVEIVEIHHRNKKDAPSGTALMLARTISSLKNNAPLKFGREGFSPRGDEVGVLAVRGGDVPGDHTVYFLGDGERIEITHRATSRETFARGAIKAAKFVAEKSSGLYSMRDVLGI